MITEKKQFYYMQAIVPIISGDVDNLECKFNEVTLSYDGTSITQPIGQVLFEKRRCAEGICVDVFLLDESEKISELIDDEYEINLDCTFTLKGKVMTYEINDRIGENIIKDVEIQCSPEVKAASTSIISDFINKNSDVEQSIFEILNRSEKLTEIINDIYNIHLEV